MNSDPNEVTIKNQREIGTSTARPPATARTMNPEATTAMSNTAMCLSHSVYALISST